MSWFACMQGGDKLRFVGKCTPNCSILIASSAGKALHFDTDDKQLHSQSRTAAGTKVGTLPQAPTVPGALEQRCPYHADVRSRPVPGLSVWSHKPALPETVCCCGLQAINLDPGASIVGMSILPAGALDEAEHAGSDRAPCLLLVTAQVGLAGKHRKALQ